MKKKIFGLVFVLVLVVGTIAVSAYNGHDTYQVSEEASSRSRSHLVVVYDEDGAGHHATCYYTEVENNVYLKCHNCSMKKYMYSYTSERGHSQDH